MSSRGIPRLSTILGVQGPHGAHLSQLNANELHNNSGLLKAPALPARLWNMGYPPQQGPGHSLPAGVINPRSICCLMKLPEDLLRELSAFHSAGCPPHPSRQDVSKPVRVASMWTLPWEPSRLREPETLPGEGHEPAALAGHQEGGTWPSPQTPPTSGQEGATLLVTAKGHRRRELVAGAGQNRQE